MMRLPAKNTRLLLALFISAAMLTACGRKGDPEAPGATPAKQTTTTPKPAVEDRPFFLDPIL